MKSLLLGVPASHPSLAAELMLGRKRVEFVRVDLLPALHKLILPLAGFPAATVPALITHGQRLQGSRTISRALDALEPDAPHLFPRDPERRAEVEQAELWGDLVLQPAARRLMWAALRRDGSTIRTFLENARTGVPTALAVRTAPPIVLLAAWGNRANNRSARRDLAALPRMLERVDELEARGTIGGAEPNAADFQLAASLRLLMALDDLRPAIDARPAGRFARRLVARDQGRVGPVFPGEWLGALRD